MLRLDSVFKSTSLDLPDTLQSELDIPPYLLQIPFHQWKDHRTIISTFLSLSNDLKGDGSLLYKEVLRTLKTLSEQESKAVPEAVKEYALALSKEFEKNENDFILAFEEAKSLSILTQQTQTLTIEETVTTTVEIESVGSTEQEEKEDKKEEPKEDKQRWISFLDSVEGSRRRHKHCLERNRILRIGAAIMPPEDMDEEDYKSLLEQLQIKPKPVIFNDIANQYYEKIKGASTLVEFERAFRFPPTPVDDDDERQIIYIQKVSEAIWRVFKKLPYIGSGELAYRSVFAHPYIEAIISCINNPDLGYCTGEKSVKAMNTQMDRLKLRISHYESYKADGIIYFKEIEIFLMENSGSYGNCTKHKASGDHHKAVYGVLGMLKTIADTYRYATFDTFQRLKVFFLQTREKIMELWSIKAEQKNSYILYREAMMFVSVDVNDKNNMLEDSFTFLNTMKDMLMETADILSQIIEEHESLTQSASADETQAPTHSLKEIVDPPIFKIIVEQGSRGLGTLDYEEYSVKLSVKK
ncbi:hypothetical protein RMATCC62417_05508 [Rhizopus microsporus]|nr:hypothetical protein RMATCC62417_05508 [Rhizopus microsporus]